MKEKKNTASEWILFSVLSVIVPVIIAYFISCIINQKLIAVSNIIDSIILMVFSIACSLLSICWSVNKQKSDHFTRACLWIAGSVMFISWTAYIVSLTNINKMNYLIQICVALCIVVIICSILGIFLGRKSDKNDNETILLMHNNCNKIRRSLVKEKYNTALKSHTLRDYDLLCNPDEFDRVDEVLKTIMNEVTTGE